MTTPPARPAPLTCPPAYVGPCARCHQPCHRYGPEASSICKPCKAALDSQQSQPAGT